MNTVSSKRNISTFGNFTKLFLNCWTDEFGSGTLVYFETLWEYISYRPEINECVSDAMNRMNDLCSSLADYKSADEAPSFKRWKGKWEFSERNAEACHSAFDRWAKDKTQAEPVNVISFCVLICLLCFHAKENLNHFPNASNPYFASKNFPTDQIVEQLGKPMGIRNDNLKKKIKEDEAFFAPFIMSAAILCSCKSEDSVKNTLNQWLNAQFQRNTAAGNWDQIKEFQMHYYHVLWKHCEDLDLHDIFNYGKRSVNSSQIADLYVAPVFSRDGSDSAVSPIGSEGSFKSLILADIGSGKSSYLQTVILLSISETLSSSGRSVSAKHIKSDTYSKLSEKLQVKKSYFPILILAEDINRMLKPKEDQSIFDLAYGSEKMKGLSSMLKEYLNTEPDQTGILLLVDALDEINDDLREPFSRILNQFFMEYENCSFIATSRKIDLNVFYKMSFMKKAKQYTIKPMDDSQIAEFIQKWISAGNDNVDSQEQLIRFFTDNLYLKPLVCNPYILSIALSYKLSPSHCNCKPNEIYSFAVDRLIRKRWPQQGELKDYEKSMRTSISKIAYEMLKNGNQEIIKFDEVRESIFNQLKLDGLSEDTGNPLIQQLIERSGLFVMTEDGYCFQSALIKDYLASEWIFSHIYSLPDLNHEPLMIDFDTVKSISEWIPNITYDRIKYMLLMLFSPSLELGTRNRISQNLLYLLLLKTAVTANVAELNAIHEIFLDVLNETFGRNLIVSTKDHANIWMMMKYISRYYPKDLKSFIEYIDRNGLNAEYKQLAETGIFTSAASR